MAKFSAFFSEKNAHLLKILLYNPIFILFPKFLELFLDAIASLEPGLLQWHDDGFKWHDDGFKRTC